MHILEIVSFLPPYGGYFAIEQAAALQSHGHEVRMLYVQQLGLTVDGPLAWLRGGADSSACYDAKGIEVFRRSFRGLPKSVRYNQKRFCRQAEQMFRQYVRKYGQPDVLHAHCAKWAGTAAMQISAVTGIPYFVTEHFSRGSYEIDFGKDWQRDTWAKDLIRSCYRGASCVIPVAAETVCRTADFFGTDYVYEEISNITDVDFFRFAERQPRTDRPFRYCCLAIANGKEFHLKGYDLLAQAFSRMNGCELHIAGRATDSPEFKAQFRQSLGSPLGDDIILHGALDRDGVRNLLYHCDALVLASRSEVQPLVVLEALSTGIPVVATSVIPQSERHEGVLISPVDDAEALRRNMLRVQDIMPSQEFSDFARQLSSADTIASKLTECFASHLNK